MTAKTATARWGIMGCASIAKKNCRAISNSPNSTLVAVASRNIDKAEKWVAENIAGFAGKVYGSYADLVNDSEIDAIYLPAPSSMHLELVTLIANAGKHVLCEKPAAINLNELEQMLSVCKKNNVQFMDGVMFMHHDRTHRLMEQVLPPFGVIQNVSRVHCNFSFDAPKDFQNGGDVRTSSADPLGCIGDLAWYCVRMGLVAFGPSCDPVSVQCISMDKNPLGVAIEASVIVNWSEGRVLQFHCSFRHAFRQTVEIIGDNCILTLDDFVIPRFESKASYSIERFSGFPLVDRDTSIVSATEKVWFTDCSQDQNMFTCFSNIVLSKTIDSKWHEISRRTQRTIDAIMKSSSDCSVVPV